MIRVAGWVAGVSIVLAALVLAGLVAVVEQRAETGDAEPVLFTVHRGEAFSLVRDRLGEQRLIRHPRALSIYAKLRRFDRQVKMGTYLFARGQRTVDVLHTLIAGDIYKVSVTIPEGFLQREIAGVLAEWVDVDSTAFVALSNDQGVRVALGVPGPLLEGYLFPDTYLIPWGAGAEDVAALMVERLDEVFDESAERRAERIGMNRHEVLTLASIVEAEARLAEERPRVAAVYLNRLRKRMRLEADPTVAYAMGGYKGRLFYKDLEIASPYNTYKYEGLPPGPICSPGRAAIHAVLYPDSTSDALFFVARGDGGHIFSRTLNEHLAAVRRVRASRAKNK